MSHKSLIVLAVSCLSLWGSGCVCDIECRSDVDADRPTECSEICQTGGDADPLMYPLGSINRAHYHLMQTNAEAADFIFHRNDFEPGQTRLNSAGRDHLLEIAARMPCSPFPVIVERSEHNLTPDLDAQRREMIVRILTDMGNVDAEHRTFVSQAYGNGMPVGYER